MGRQQLMGLMGLAGSIVDKLWGLLGQAVSIRIELRKHLMNLLLSPFFVWL